MRKVVGAALVAGLAAAPVSGQFVTDELRPVTASGGIQVIGAVSTGEFADYVDGGFGIGANLVWPVQTGGAFAIRADLGWIVYGSEKKDLCFPGEIGCRITLELSTTNSIFYLNAGPQLMLPEGFVRPYVNANAGLAYFATTSSVKGDNNDEAFASDTNFDDFTFAWGAGGGLLVPLSRGRTPIAIDLGATYHANGSVEYLTEGDIIDNPDGSITITPTRSEANFVAIRLGVTIGFRPGVN